MNFSDLQSSSNFELWQDPFNSRLKYYFECLTSHKWDRGLVHYGIWDPENYQNGFTMRRKDLQEA